MGIRSFLYIRLSLGLSPFFPFFNFLHSTTAHLRARLALVCSLHVRNSRVSSRPISLIRFAFPFACTFICIYILYIYIYVIDMEAYVCIYVYSCVYMRECSVCTQPILAVVATART